MATSPFKRPLKEYSAIYGVSYRTILRWKDSGYPLDDERQTRLLVSAGVKPAPASHANGAVAAFPVESGAQGLKASLDRLAQEEAAAYGRYRQALESGDDQGGTVPALQRQWLEIQAAHVKAASANPDVEQANKNLIKVDLVASELTEMFQTLRQDLEQLGKRVAGELVGKDEISIREVINRETALLIGNLYSCKYLEEKETNE
jgi:phage terminase Nu1 subunit (DNA packaging protein)